MRDEMCLTDDLYAGCFTVITPTERNYCCKQKLASHKSICIHLTWRRASRCHLWQQTISHSARIALTAIHGKTEKNERHDEKKEWVGICHLVWRQKVAAPLRPECPHKCCVTYNIAVEKQRKEMTHMLMPGTHWLWSVQWEWFLYNVQAAPG